MIMKVLCIDDSIGRNYGNIPNFVYNEVLDVLDASFRGWDDYYIVLKQPKSNDGKRNLYWHKRRFIPCSDQENIVLEDVLVLKNQ